MSADRVASEDRVVKEDRANPALDGLVRVVVEDAQAALRRLRDRHANEGRDLVRAAEEHVEELERAARDLGRVRGEALEEAFQREADHEMRSVLEGGFERLFERFERKVQTALEGLRETDRYAPAVRAWAAAAVRALDGPADVHAAPEDRQAVYDALLEAGAVDFQVHRDRDIRLGFVVRDLDGRTLLDRRPEAIVRERTAALRDLLRARVPAPPSTDRA